MSGDEIRFRRRALRMTQAELAEALGVEKNTVARWERDKLAFNTKMLRLALMGLQLERYETANASELELTPALLRKVQRQIEKLQASRQALQQMLAE